MEIVIIYMVSMLILTLLQLYSIRCDNSIMVDVSEDIIHTNKLFFLTTELTREECNERNTTTELFISIFDQHCQIGDEKFKEKVRNRISSWNDTDTTFKTLDNMKQTVSDNLFMQLAVLTSIKPNIITASKETREKHRYLINDIYNFAKENNLVLLDYPVTKTQPKEQQEN